ncbi:hypothetical protein CH276_02150 [Rhodococcus sp. 06-470-2]|uniref:hypothetical protein n=1 Tax=unclassified Rhodococcus (in: high G+C Gram-positive bacteria) TaxID=192944 RepID=UPI000B9B5A16|nr:MULTISPECIES: hypothetical protein [unclassified Rhodococcus (in: high G+C Gram-positive bacteria)]OZC70218.1 hypothetical protein CH276_02150 [Rhodococcus sp. 06-470-2]OZE59749.1 hypothetical protein CH265_20480 [Rhodococcus sp. 05-2221-1B]
MAWNAKYNGQRPCSICGLDVIAGQRVEWVWVDGKRSVVHVHEQGASKQARKWNSGHWEPAKVAGRMKRAQKRQTPPTQTGTP